MLKQSVHPEPDNISTKLNMRKLRKSMQKALRLVNQLMLISLRRHSVPEDGAENKINRARTTNPNRNAM